MRAATITRTVAQPVSLERHQGRFDVNVIASVNGVGKSTTLVALTAVAQGQFLSIEQQDNR